jgi:hypothetical protein
MKSYKARKEKKGFLHMKLSHSLRVTIVVPTLMTGLIAGCGAKNGVNKRRPEKTSVKDSSNSRGTASGDPALQLTLPQNTVDLSAKSGVKVSRHFEQIFTLSKQDPRIQMTCDEETSTVKGVVAVALISRLRDFPLKLSLGMVAAMAPDEIDFSAEPQLVSSAEKSPEAGAESAGNSPAVEYPTGAMLEPSIEKEAQGYPSKGPGPRPARPRRIPGMEDTRIVLLKYSCKTSAAIKVKVKDALAYNVYVRTYALNGQATDHGLSSEITSTTKSMTMDLKSIYSDVSVIVKQ